MSMGHGESGVIGRMNEDEIDYYRSCQSQLDHLSSTPSAFPPSPNQSHHQLRPSPSSSTIPNDQRTQLQPQLQHQKALNSTPQSSSPTSTTVQSNKQNQPPPTNVSDIQYPPPPNRPQLLSPFQFSSTEPSDPPATAAQSNIIILPSAVSPLTLPPSVYPDPNPVLLLHHHHCHHHHHFHNIHNNSNSNNSNRFPWTMAADFSTGGLGDPAALGARSPSRPPQTAVSTSSVTNFTFQSLVEQNNLSDDSCLVVISDKVYDLTLWLQDQLSSSFASPSLSTPQSSSSVQPPSPSYDPLPLPPSPSASPPPSLSSLALAQVDESPTQPSGADRRPWMQADSRLQSSSVRGVSDPPQTQLEALHRLLELSKSDPLGAGESFREIFEADEPLRLGFLRGQANLEDWLQEFRIGDYARPISTEASDEQPETSPAASSITSGFPFSKIFLDCHNHQQRTAPERPLQSSCHESLNKVDRCDPSQSFSSEPFGQFPDLDSPSIEAGNREAQSTVDPNDQTLLAATQERKRGPSHLERAMELVKRLKAEVVNAQRGVGMANLSLNDAWAQLVEAEKVRDHLVMQACEGFRPIWHEWGHE